MYSFAFLGNHDLFSVKFIQTFDKTKSKEPES
jgi:hypothetical protein